MTKWTEDTHVETPAERSDGSPDDGILVNRDELFIHKNAQSLLGGRREL
jgi:hypothetical protein